MDSELGQSWRRIAGRTMKPCYIQGVGLDCEPAVLSSYAPDKVPASRHVSFASLVALLLGSCDNTALCPVITYIGRSCWCHASRE